MDDAKSTIREFLKNGLERRQLEKQINSWIKYDLQDRQKLIEYLNMGWNYRVYAHEQTIGGQNNICFEILETYYDQKGVPNGYIENKSVISDDLKGLTWQMNKMKLALKKPIISVKNFPKEYDRKTT